MKGLSVLALVGVSNAAMLTWNGPAINFDSATSWSGAPGNWPSLPSTANPASVTFGSLSGPIQSGLSQNVVVGNSLTFNAPHGASIVFRPGASLTFGNAGSSAVTFLPATTGFSSPGQTPTAVASSFQYNCPLNWLVTGTSDRPLTAPQATDDVTIASTGYFVSTFAQRIAAQTLTAGTMFSDGAAMCFGNEFGLTFGQSTLDWGGSPQGCPNAFMQGLPTVPSSCGDLVVTQLTGSTPGTIVLVYSCPNGAASCGPNGNTAVVINNSTGTATSGTPAPVTVAPAPGPNGGVTISVPGATGGSVTTNTNGVAPSVSDPDGESSSSGGVPMLLIVIIVAVVVVVAVAAVLYVKRDKPAPAGAASNQRGAGFGGVGFENPLYDEHPRTMEGGPSYEESSTDNAGYMDVPAPDDNEGTYDETGYMDVPAEGGDDAGAGGGGGYMDVNADAEGDDDDDF